MFSLTLRHTTKKQAMAVMALLSCLCLASPAYAEHSQEDTLISAYLVNFSKFIQWPETPDNSTINLCLAGKNVRRLHAELLSGRNIGNNRNLSVIISPKNLEDCHLLFIDKKTSQSAVNSLKLSSHKSLVTITEKEYEPEIGVIRLFVHDLKLRFIINQNLAEKADYKISSKLMRLSRKLN